jgi:hypothetical protein
MQTLIIEIDSNSKAKELTSLLSSMDFVKKVSSIRNPKASIVKRKNKAIARYL